MPVEDTSPSKENLKDAIFQAAELFKSADFAEAQKRCQTILLSHPGNLEAHYMLLRMEWQQGHVSTAVAKLKRFLNKAPDWQQGEQALKVFEETIEKSLNSEHTQLYLQLRKHFMEYPRNI